MKTKPVVQIGDPVLRTRGRVLTTEEITSRTMQELMDIMVNTMHAENGIGIAAQQIGESLMLAIVSHADGDLVVCNPKIMKRSTFRREASEEGCLSVRGVFGVVRRYKSITVAFQDRTGKKIRMQAHGLLARVFQHEIDHLDGKVFLDRTKHITQGQRPRE